MFIEMIKRGGDDVRIKEGMVTRNVAGDGDVTIKK